MPWLMKAEPDSRIVKGKDVKFSVDDFEEIGTSPWDGVRNHQAKNSMRDHMKIGDQVLFYHSNCKEPGVQALAEVVKEGYPDYTAWDSSHPYFDPKTDKDAPTWFMVDVRFIRRLSYPPTLAFLKYLAGCTELPDAISYIGEDGLAAIKAMTLVRSGRLSVQNVDPAAYEAVIKLGEKGGWDELVHKAKEAKEQAVPKQKAQRRTKAKQLVTSDDSDDEAAVKVNKRTSAKSRNKPTSSSGAETKPNKRVKT